MIRRVDAWNDADGSAAEGTSGLVWNDRSRHDEPAMQPQVRRTGYSVGPFRVSGKPQAVPQTLQVCWFGARSWGRMDRRYLSGLSMRVITEAESMMG